MTVCIAAECKDSDGASRIVLCADDKISSVLGSSETGFKLRPIDHGWYMLTAGSVSDILAFGRLYDVQFADKSSVTAESIDASIKNPIFLRKKELANQFIIGKLAITYDEFLKTGKEKLPADIFHNALVKVDELHIGVELILAGFISDYPEIYQVDSDGSVRAMQNYAVTGEGKYLAEASLLRREQHNYTRLEATLYNVYEAKRYAQAVSSVGERTSMWIMDDTGGAKLVSNWLDKRLAEMYVELGPKPVPRKLKFEGPLTFHDEVSASSKLPGPKSGSEQAG